MLTKKNKILKLAGDFFSIFLTREQRPILVVGLPRTGTTWIASVLNTAAGIEYFHEPFNPINIHQSASHLRQAMMMRKYLAWEDEDEEFARYCRATFAGELPDNGYLYNYLGWIYKQFPQWHGRVLIKDVHCYLTLNWLKRQVNPLIVIVLRHPCAVAASWFRLYGKVSTFERSLFQPKLLDDYLQSFIPLLEQTQGFWQRIGAFWGASYYVMLQQQAQHPDWIVIQHEDFCRDPMMQYRQLFQKLQLNWTVATSEILEVSTRKSSKDPYVPLRISAQEPQKWEKELEPQQIAQVMEFANSFGIQFYQ
ncbi:sulfotransferase family protein [Oscillatoria salina]|uniref:sulfotransferase family protein n=1 Tax=Oscillatoria salina TaxID=331517 RepID=UPI0013B72F9C|nr:sulfotransferase [Oscillatoria salina]MBZ8182196.1 sulfotransferase [Oscillatoria salina IIICB1]NET89061.1 sulfotransferase [Kamptonema sp. SIO1D9]